VGNNEFYQNYAAKAGICCLLDTGHYHPTEVVSDKIPALLAFHDKVALHVSRPVRWDSDHVVILDDELKELVTSLDEYGKYTQYFLDYNTDNISEAPKPERIKDVTEETLQPYEKEEDIKGTVEGLSYYKNSMEVESDTRLRTYYTLASGHSIDEYEFTIDGAEAEAHRSSSTRYGTVKADIVSTDLGEKYTFTAKKKGNEEAYITIRASVLSYCYTILEENKSEEAVNVAKAMYNYSQAANAYFE
jgi:hypothetical protein